MPENHLQDLSRRALDALREQHQRAMNELARSYAELAQAYRRELGARSFDSAPELAAGKFRVVCFAIRIGDVSKDDLNS